MLELNPIMLVKKLMILINVDEATPMPLVSRASPSLPARGWRARLRCHLVPALSVHKYTYTKSSVQQEFITPRVHYAKSSLCQEFITPRVYYAKSSLRQEFIVHHAKSSLRQEFIVHYAKSLLRQEFNNP